MYKEPKEPSKGSTQFRRDEVESHSSALTNQRIFNIKEEVWISGYDALSDPIIDKRTYAVKTFLYFGSIVQEFINTEPIYYTENNIVMHQGDKIKLGKIITDMIKAGLKLRKNIRGNPSPKLEDIEALMNVALQIQLLMTRGQQNLRYLFRIATQEPRGLVANLELFSGSGVWGGEDGKD